MANILYCAHPNCLHDRTEGMDIEDEKLDYSYHADGTRETVWHRECYDALLKVKGSKGVAYLDSSKNPPETFK